MSRKEDFREPDEKSTQNVVANDVTDPLLSAQPKEREYTKIKATVITDIPGQIPDIPEQEQAGITVDFTKPSEPLGGDDGGGSGDDGGKNKINHEGISDDSGLYSDESDKGSSTVDFTHKEKMLMAQVITSMGIEGLGVVNDYIINRYSITEQHVTDKILAGDADPDILNYKLDVGGGTMIDIQIMLANNLEVLQKTFAFDKDEQKRISELIALILKDKNIELKPEYALLAMIVQKYGIGIYQMNKVRNDTETILNRVNELLANQKAKHNVGNAGPVIENRTDADLEKAKVAKASAAAASTVESKKGKVKKTKPSTFKKPVIGSKKAAAPKEEYAEDSADIVASPIGDIREPGEGSPSRRPKRSVPKHLLDGHIQDVEYEKINQ